MPLVSNGNVQMSTQVAGFLSVTRTLIKLANCMVGLMYITLVIKLLVYQF